MPWIIASQTIPILALAPMIIVVLGAIGITGLLPKAVISMYLSFFPVAVGMVKGLPLALADADGHDAHLQRQPLVDTLEVEVAGFDSVSVCQSQSGGGLEPGGGNRR